MRIAYVGNFGPPWSTENDVRTALMADDHDVICLQENSVRYSEIRRQAARADLLLWTGTWDDAQPLDESIETMHQCARAGIPTATIHLDTFWPTSRGGRRWWLHPMFHTSHIFTASGDDEALWRAWGKQHHWLPPAVRHTVPEGLKFIDRSSLMAPEYACDVAFVGSNGDGYHEDIWPYRRELVYRLRDICERRGWSFRNPGGFEPKIERDQMDRFYASAKVVVGDSLCPKRENSQYWSDRVPETFGRRGYMIMPRIHALKEIYPEMPQYSWGDFEGLEARIGTSLESDEHRMHVADACYRRTLEAHTYKHRMRTLLQTVAIGVDT